MLFFDMPLVEEILHQLMGSLVHYIQGFIHPRGCRISSINSISEKLKKEHISMWGLNGPREVPPRHFVEMFTKKISHT